MTDDPLARLLAAEARLRAEEHRSESRIIAARQALHSAQQRQPHSPDLFAAVPYQVQQAQTALDDLLRARQERAVRLQAIRTEIAECEHHAEAKRNPPISSPPWSSCPGPAAMTSLYDREGNWIGDIRSAEDADHILALVNLPSRLNPGSE